MYLVDPTLIYTMHAHHHYLLTKAEHERQIALTGTQNGMASAIAAALLWRIGKVFIGAGLRLSGSTSV